MATPSTSTRDRLLDEAMRLFGERGYDATSVAEIERSAGLTPGAGGLFHHFRTKEAVLVAGLALGALVACASADLLLGQAPVDADREDVIATWVEMVMGLVAASGGE